MRLRWLVSFALVLSASQAEAQQPGGDARLRLHVSTNLTVEHPAAPWTLFQLLGHGAVERLCDLPCTTEASPRNLGLGQESGRIRRLALPTLNEPSSIHLHVQNVVRDYEYRVREWTGAGLILVGGLMWIAALPFAIAGARRDKRRMRNAGLGVLLSGIVTESVGGLVILLDDGPLRADVQVRPL
ncbi:MAG: hypothetical protein AAF411_21830 [Myxococcota bacterium]